MQIVKSVNPMNNEFIIIMVEKKFNIMLVPKCL